MLVKQTIGKAVSVFESKSASIIYAGCEGFDEAITLAKQGLLNEDMSKPVAAVLYTPKYTADPSGNETIIDEQIATSVRSDVVGEPLAVLITDDSQILNGSRYQFLYSVDSVELMTDHGFAVASFNRKAEKKPIRACRE